MNIFKVNSKHININIFNFILYPIILFKFKLLHYYLNKHVLIRPPWYGSSTQATTDQLYEIVQINNSFRLRVYPASFAFREDIEIGDKILLPQSALNQLYPLMSRGPLIFCITNLGLLSPKRTYCGVLEFVAEEGINEVLHRTLLYSELDVQNAKFYGRRCSLPNFFSSRHQK